ncbi:MAG: GAF domain-containing protein [Chitinophagaceae bacterium]|nr:GAF domain-containing protein [Anaerolineae bacterium]
MRKFSLEGESVYMRLDGDISSTTEIELLRKQVEYLSHIQAINVRLNQIPSPLPLLDQLVNYAAGILPYGRVIALIIDDEEVSLQFAAINTAIAPRVRQQLESVRINTYLAMNDPTLREWVTGKSVDDQNSASPTILAPFKDLLGIEHFYSLPLTLNLHLIGALIIEIPNGQHITPDDEALLESIALTATFALQNARNQNHTLQKMTEEMNLLYMMQQIDRELNDTIALDTVFNMTLDWALRFSSAHAGFITLYDAENDELGRVFPYGYETGEALERLQDSRITLRVARTREAEILPDVRLDEDTLTAAHNILSQMSVPVMREDQVIAIITLESRKVNAFQDKHLNFALQLANRAAVAIDNARLYTETVREREKLSSILSSLAEVVIVVDPEGHIVMLNPSATSSLQLYQDKSYIGQLFTEVIGFTPLENVYRRARDMNENVTEDLSLPNGRTFHTNAALHKEIGCIIVMQDVTPYKEMDRLKSELIATVSHDLKQPLSVMMGYLDLLQMRNKFNEQSQGFVSNIDRAIRNMRQLIDDLLDMARMESGMELEMIPVSMSEVLNECTEVNRAAADIKNITLSIDFAQNLPHVDGERSRLYQIFNNLIGNAIKYTPPQGEVIFKAEQRGSIIRVMIQDNGIGISPEDQAHVFDRFYRVRRPETDSIEGTGLGLAIVKALIEAHHGKIRVESRLNEGSTFYVTLPVSDYSLF